MTERIPEQKCLECGKRIDSIGDATDEPGSRGPRPGDAIACMYCGAVMTIGDDRRIRPFTDEEIAALTSDAAYMDEIARFVARIHFFRASESAKLN